MGQVSPFLRRWSHEGRAGVLYWCQGCEDAHVVTIEPQGGAGVWGFNGNYDKPTFTPSVLVTSGHYVAGWKEGAPCWCSYNAQHPDDPGPLCHRCHTFITDGMVQFLGDCTHALAGQTLPLPPLPDWLKDETE